jgi:tetratricopeptide (TPR) repeat protein
MRTLRVLMIGAAVAGLLPQAISAAPSQTDFKSCFDDSGEVAIAACTRAINSGQYKGERLGRLYGARAFEYRATQDFDRALADYNESIRLFPQIAENFDGRATILAEKGNYRAAIGDYTAALKLQNSGYVAVNRGIVYLRLKEYDNALADYRRGSSFDSKDATDFERRCFARGVVGDLHRALSDCEESLRRRTNSAFTTGSRGFAHLKLGRIDEAIADFSIAVDRLRPTVLEVPLFRYGRGIARLKKGDVEGGNADIAAAKNAWPEIAETFARLGVK